MSYCAKLRDIRLKVAITGANGFIGVHIIHHLLISGHEVAAIKREAGSLDEFEKIKSYYQYPQEKYSALNWHNVELFDVAGLSDVFSSCDVVIHGAGLISYLKRDEQALMQVNVEHTANVVNAALLAQIKQFCLMSSTASITRTNHKLTEEGIWDDKAEHSIYGYTKYLAECELWRGIEEGLNGFCINPGIVLGYGDWNKGSLKLFKNAYNSFPFYTEGITGFIGVEDVARITLSLINSEAKGRHILISENKQFKEVSFAMAKAFNKKPPKWKVSGFFANIVYRLIAIMEFLRIGSLLTKETAKAAMRKSEFDNKKLLSKIEFELSPINQVIDKSAKAFLKRL